MSIRAAILIACLTVAASPLLHAENCAWLNAATAGGILGTDASLKLDPIAEHLTPAQTSARLISGARPDAVCTFLPQQAASTAQLAPTAQLQIAVHSMANISAEFPTYTAACGKDPIALRAVGNEAIECSSGDDKRYRIEKVIARARDRAFLITWTIPGPVNGPNAMTQDAIREKMRNLAEQVAGSLF